MTRARQVEKERQWATMMVDLLDLKLRDPPAKEDPPLPDISIALADGRRIAVEVTRAVDEALHAGYRGASVRIAQQVDAAMKRRCLNVHAGLVMPSRFLASVEEQAGKDQRSVVDRIVELVAEAHSQLNPGHIGLIYTDMEFVATDQLRKAGDLASRGLSGLVSVSVNSWPYPVVSRAVTEDCNGPELIQTAIDKKADNTYDVTNCDELWLLVVGGTGIGSMVDVSAAARRTFCVNSRFARAFFLVADDPRCIPLRTQPPA